MTPGDVAELRAALAVVARVLGVGSLSGVRIRDIRRALIVVVGKANGDGRGSYGCALCGDEGHNSRGCRKGKTLYRCNECSALVWGRERHMHLHDTHGITASPRVVAEFYQMATRATEDEDNSQDG